MKARTLSVSIDCEANKVYEFVIDPENLPKWAGTFAKSIRKINGEWVLETEQGPVKVRFAAKNEFGILDHYVSPAPGQELFVPMRVVQNGTGCEMIFTLFQSPGMSDENYAKDLSLVEQDLRSLKELMERK